MKAEAWITIAKLGKPHGVGGELRVWPQDASSKTLFGVREVRVVQKKGGESQHYKIRRCRQGSRFLIVALDGVAHRDQAAALTGALLSIPFSQLPALEPDEYYHRDLLGFVVESEGQPLGVLEEILDTGAHDTLVIRDREAGIECMVPFLKSMVEVDVEGRVLLVNPPEGLIEATRGPIGDRS